MINEVNIEHILFDPVNFTETFIKIRNKDKELVPFILNEIQRDYAKNSSWRGEPFKGERDIILKARQFGFTTWKMAEYFHDTIINPGTNTVIAAHRDDVAMKLLERIKIMYNNLPDEIKPEVNYDNKRELSFEKLGSRIMVTTQGKGLGRSDVIHNLLLTEIAYWEHAEDKVTGLTEAVPFYGNITIESTPNGVGNYFYKIVNDARQGKSAYKLFVYEWFLFDEYKMDINSPHIPDFIRIKFNDSGEPILDSREIELVKEHKLTLEQLQWRRFKMLELGDLQIDAKTKIFKSRKFAQEYECDFVQSGRIWIDKEVVKVVMINDLDLRGRRLATGVDTAEGIEGGDECAAVTIDIDTGEEIRWLRGLWKPKEFSKKLHPYMCEVGGICGIEVNNTGLAVIERMEELWDNDFYEYYITKQYDKIKYVLYKTKKRVGWFTSSSTRVTMFVDGEELIREGFIKVNKEDKILYNEIIACQYDKNNVPKAPEGFTDHSLIALLIAIQMRKYYNQYQKLLLLSSKSSVFKKDTKNGVKIIGD